MIRLSVAQVERLRALESAAGELTPAAVVADARRKDSPLHGLFEWDVRKAAAAHWREQACEVIRSVRVQVTTATTEIRVARYLADPEPPPGRYRALEAMSEDEQRAAVVQECLRAVGHMKRAVAVAQSAGLDVGLDELLTAWTARVDGLLIVPELSAAAD